MTAGGRVAGRTAGRPGAGLHPLQGGRPGPLPAATEGSLPTRTLVAGLPRSGTSWLADVLGSAPEARLVFEPENLDLDVWAASAIGSAEGFEPVLRPGDHAPLYELMWEWAFRGGRPDGRPSPVPPGLNRLLRRARPAACRVIAGSPWPGPPVWRARLRRRRRLPEPGHVIVKTVVASMAIEWLVDRFLPQVLVIHREPLDVIASWVAMGFPPRPTPADPLIAARILADPRVPPLAPGASLVQRIAWGVGVRKLALEDACARHPDWLVVRHEDLVDAPLELFPLLFERLGLAWTEAAESRLKASDAAGTGYQTARRWSELRQTRARRLSSQDAAAAQAVLGAFPGNLVAAPAGNLRRGRA